MLYSRFRFLNKTHSVGQVAARAYTAEKTKTARHLLKAYDYIIVGGGTAGCVLANRLSEDPLKMVLLIEAGRDDTEFPDIHVPAKWADIQRTEFDWQYKSIPQKHSCRGYHNQQSSTPRGKVLGGTGSINAMVLCRGTPRDFDLWQKMGCKGWGYEDVLPYFMKSEDCNNPKMLRSGVRGEGGPMGVTESRYSYRPDIFIEAGVELGYQETDVNGRCPIGVGDLQLNTKDGLRSHTATTFLRPTMERENLHITTHCHVTKIHVDDNIARAVEFSRLQNNEIIRARKEIILSAGTIGSAQILMLSGFGPREHLEEVGVPVVAELPVGSFLQDHVGVHGLEFQTECSIFPGTSPFSVENTTRYDEMRSGPISTNLAEGIGFFRSKHQSPDDDNAAIAIVAYPIAAELRLEVEHRDDGRAEITYSLSCVVFSSMYPRSHDPGKSGVTFFPYVCHPRSKGTVRLNRADLQGPPLIDPNYLADSEDVKTLVEGIRICLEFSKTKTYQALGTKLLYKELSDYKGAPLTDEYWEEYARTLTQTVHHLSGTCRMGRPEDPTTVTDPQLRVKGIGRLRVVDASVMPEVTSGNTFGPVVMIAEKAADMIKHVV